MSDWSDPLYRRRDELPGSGAAVVFAGVRVEVAVTDTSPDVIEAQWMDDREVTLAVTDDLEPAALARVLPEFAAHAASRADRPTTAALALPSRDVARAKVARDAGFLPASIQAVAELRRPIESTGLAVRDAVPADAAALAALWREQADYEAGVGTLRTSEPIRAAIGAHATASIAGTSTVLVTEVDGRLAGAIVAEATAESGWAGARLTVDPVSYLSMASTSAAVRSRGIGAGLVTELHRRHRAAGVPASTLHYSAFNPLSVPFWSQQGYRPVLTFYARRVHPSR